MIWLFVIVTVIRTVGWFIGWNFVIVDATGFGKLDAGDALLIALCYGLITSTVELPMRSRDEDDEPLG